MTPARARRVEPAMPRADAGERLRHVGGADTRLTVLPARDGLGEAVGTSPDIPFGEVRRSTPRPRAARSTETVDDAQPEATFSSVRTCRGTASLGRAKPPERTSVGRTARPAPGDLRLMRANRRQETTNPSRDKEWSAVRRAAPTGNHAARAATTSTCGRPQEVEDRHSARTSAEPLIEVDTSPPGGRSTAGSSSGRTVAVAWGKTSEPRRAPKNEVPRGVGAEEAGAC